MATQSFDWQGLARQLLENTQLGRSLRSGGARGATGAMRGGELVGAFGLGVAVGAAVGMLLGGSELRSKLGERMHAMRESFGHAAESRSDGHGQPEA